MLMNIMDDARFASPPSARVPREPVSIAFLLFSKCYSYARAGFSTSWTPLGLKSFGELMNINEYQ